MPPGHMPTLLILLLTNYCFGTIVSDTSVIKSHLTAITKTEQFRTYKNIDQLNKTADYFKTEYMGSYIHAKSLADNKTEVYGMISLEMIGYFKDEKKSQSYPLGILSLFYGNKGNYITLVKKFGAGQFARRFCRKYKSTDVIRTKKFTGPPALPGIDFSDHMNYWKFGFSALMITDTSFYRNKNYHKPTDTMETLDINRMAKVIDDVFKTLTTI